MTLTFKDLVEINNKVNQTITYRADTQQYGKAEFWEIPLKYGDCEDIALKKRQILLEQKVNPDTIKLATCWTETGGYHAVLIVTIADGDYVLDNRRQLPAIKQDLPYKWDKIQIKNKWYKLS